MIRENVGVKGRGTYLARNKPPKNLWWSNSNIRIRSQRPLSRMLELEGRLNKFPVEFWIWHSLDELAARWIANGQIHSTSVTINEKQGDHHAICDDR